MAAQHTDKLPKSSEQQHKRAVQPAQPSTMPDTDSSDMLHLQSVVGNRAAQRLIQTKLTVGAPDDVYEQEADQVAQQVMAMPAPDAVQREAAPEEEELSLKRVQREAMPEEDELSLKRIQRADLPVEEDELLAQTKSDGGVPEVTDDLESQINSMSGNGQTLPDSARDFFEPRFGQDFSGVNIHTGGEADALNRSLEARAFATGSDIFFRDGEYNPESSSGRELLAHELTHVVQQGASPVQTKNEDCEGC
jgi:hypothetical protein